LGFLVGRPKQLLDKVSVPVWVSTNNQTADAMTKALGKDEFIALRNAMLNISFTLYTFTRGHNPQGQATHIS